MREVVKDSIVSTDRDIARIALLGKGLREAGQTVINAYRTFADKPEMDYAQKEQKYIITKVVLAPMKAMRKMLVSMELHFDASIDKLDNLSMNVQRDKEIHRENIEYGVEGIEAESVYAPMIAEMQKYQYNSDAFEARGELNKKQEVLQKEMPKIKDENFR